MAKKFTYEELEQRIKKLEEETKSYKQVKEKLADCKSKECIQLETLHKSEGDFITFFNNTAVGMAMLDVGNPVRFLAINKILADITGVPVKDHIGKTIAEVFDDNNAAKENNIVLQSVIKTKKPTILESMGLTQDGRTICYHTQFFPIFGKNGNPVSIGAIVSDITEPKQAEEEREKLIEELQEALEKVKTLRGLLPICSKCKKIRDDKGYWNNLEEYIQTYSEVSFSHGMCSDCSDELYGSENWYIEMKKKEKQKE